MDEVPQDVIEDVLEIQNRQTEIYINEIVCLANELRESGDLKLCLNIEYYIKELLLSNGIFIGEMRDISEDANFGR